MNFKTSIYTFLLIIFISCNDANKFIEEGSARIEIPIKQIGKIKFGQYSDIYDSIKLIKLQTTNESLIGRIDKILFYNNRYYILDQVQRKAVLQFDANGKFIRRFGRNGSGPGEYDEPNDIAINKFTNQIVIWSINSRKLITYDLEGKFYKEFRIDFFAKCFSIINKDLIALYLDNGNKAINYDNKFNLKIINTKGEVINSAFNIEKSDELPRGGFNFFNQGGKEALISPGYSNNIYSIRPDSLIHKFKINFGPNTIPTSFFQKALYKFEEDLKKSNYAYLNKYFETPKYLVFSFVSGGKVYDCFYSKQSKTLKFANMYLNDVMGILTGINMTTYKDYVIGYYDPSNINTLKQMINYPVNVEKLKKETIKSFETIYLNENDSYIKNYINSVNFKFSKEEIASIKSINPSDNPILLVKKLKSF